MNPYRPFTHNWWSYFLNYPYFFRIGIRNVYDYFNIIWNDRDWDQVYLYKLIIFKLKRMEDAQKESGFAHDLKTAKQLKVTRLALERIYKDDYWIFGQYTFDRDGGNRLVALRRQDLELFAKYFTKYSQGWWN